MQELASKLLRFINPTPEDLVGPAAAQQFHTAVAGIDQGYEKTRQRLEPLVTKLVPIVQQCCFSHCPEMTVAYLPPHFIDFGDCYCYSAHYFAIRLKDYRGWSCFLPRLLHRRTVLLVGIDDVRNGNWLRLSVSNFVPSHERESLFSQVIASLAPVGISAEWTQTQVGHSLRLDEWDLTRMSW